MARRRMIEVSIAYDEHLNALSEFAQLTFIRILPHTDDAGRFDGNPRIIRARVMPLSDRKDADVFKAICEIIQVGLLRPYLAGDKVVLQYNPAAFSRINAVLIKNSTVKSEYPDPREEDYLTLEQYKEHVSGTCLARTIVSSKQQAVSSKQQESLVNPDFASVWKRYPSKTGKPEALRHFRVTVQTPEDLAAINKALDNYLKSERVKNGFIQNGSTWFNDWQAWIEPTDAMMKSGKNGTTPEDLEAEVQKLREKRAKPNQ